MRKIENLLEPKIVDFAGPGYNIDTGLAIQLSIAISLKRIADMHKLEMDKKIDEVHKLVNNSITK